MAQDVASRGGWSRERARGVDRERKDGRRQKCKHGLTAMGQGVGRRKKQGKPGRMEQETRLERGRVMVR